MFRLNVYMNRNSHGPSFFHDREKETECRKLAFNVIKEGPKPERMEIVNAEGFEVYAWERG